MERSSLDLMDEEREGPSGCQNRSFVRLFLRRSSTGRPAMPAAMMWTSERTPSERWVGRRDASVEYARQELLR